MSDLRYFETYYGIHTDDWDWDFGKFSDHHYILTKEYVNEACTCKETSTASDSYEFLYPHHIKKKYFIEGVITGHITFASSGATAYLCRYRVSLRKANTDSSTSPLFTTGWISVNKTLDWNNTYNIGEEVVLPFWMDAWDYKELSEDDRIYVKIESTCTDDANFTSCAESSCTNVVLWHSNDATWEDIKITIPFMM